MQSPQKFDPPHPVREFLRGVPWWVWTGAALLIIIIAAGVFFVAQYRPSKHFVFATGREGGAYYLFAQQYQALMADKGYTMTLLPTAGSVAILQALKEGKADVGFVQGGISNDFNTSNLVTLASVFYEPLWIFYRQDAFAHDPAFMRDLKGKRIAIGEKGSGSELLVHQLLADNGVTETNSSLVPIGMAESAKQLKERKIDVLMFVSAPAAAIVHDLLVNPQFGLLSMYRTLAYHRRYPYLMPVTLAQGSLDLANDVPSHDYSLLAPVAKLVARSDIAPDIMRLVLSDAQTVHGKGGLLEEQGEFPSTKYAEIPMAQDAKQYLESGPTGLERYLPYWLASRMEWFIFVILPILVLAYPLLSNIPSLYDNYIHTQIDRWYVEVRKVEKQLPVYNVAELDEKITWTDDLHEFLTRRVHVPMFYLSDYYQLRGALGVVIERLEKRRRVVLLRQEELANLALLNAGEEVVTEFGSAGAASVPPPQATPAALSPNNGNSGPPDSGPPDLP